MTISLRDFGSYFVGGRFHEVTEGAPYTVNFTRSASYPVDPRGHFAVEHGYVQYYVPEPRLPGPPVLLVHGGGMSGSCWETTPDGRPGWLNLLLERGYEVHLLDNMERGRAGFAPGLWGGEPLLRSLEEAWNLFRIGHADGFAARKAFAGQRFPVDAFEIFSRCFVPRWLSTSALHTATILAALEKIGPAVVICHSQGGELTFDAHARRPDLFASIIALEPSGWPEEPSALLNTPCVICAGDFLDTADHWAVRSRSWRNLVEQAKALGAPTTHLSPETGFGIGGSHMLMMDETSADNLDHALSALRCN